MIEFLTGSYTRRDSQGIMKVTFDPSTKSITSSLYVKLDNPTYLCSHKDLVFSVGAVNDEAGLVLIHQGVIKDMLLLEKSVPCHISVNPTLQHVYTANYHQGQIMISSYHEHVLNHVQTIQFPLGSKAHYVGFEDSHQLLIMCDLGLDCVRAFRYNGRTYELVYEVKFPKGSGPRHAVKHPKLPILYVLTELSGEIFVCDMNEESLNIRSSRLSYPSDYLKPWAAAIRLSSDGKHCYASNRGHDSISHFVLDEKGNPNFQSRISSHGQQPRDFNLLDDDQYCCVLNHDDNKCVIFERQDDGSLEPITEHIIHEGVCVCLT